ncbi:MAG: iron chelate uptake ABC transporter family permease subunit [Alphaproteobacteria bacterium]|nr:iron chelate uptake ABC transporter family permease subunit [Alphaproteobacteria bacterium]
MGKRESASLTAHRSTGARWWVLPLLFAVLLVLSVLALAVGPYPLSPGDAIAMIFRSVSGGETAGSREGTVLFAIRLPRVIAALTVGGALAAAGAAYQGMFRNPLVSPDILGVSSGAGLGAVLGIFLSLPVLAIQGMAFLGGIAAVSLVTAIAAAVRNRDALLILVLAGVVVGALAGAATSLLKVLADPYDQLPAITFWLLGSLAAMQAEDILAAAPLVIAAMLPLALLRWRINVLAMGDEEAKSLGVDAGRLRIAVVGCATLMTAAVVSISGVVGWVGLVIPHVARMIVGPNFATLLPASILLGAGYMVIVDTLARTIATVEVPLGILTAIIGAPVFIWLLARGRRSWA